MVDDEGPAQWSIDEDNIQEWPAEVAQLENYRQGSLIERPPFAYHANSQLPLWGLTQRDPEPSADAMLEMRPEDRPPYGMIITQSCDIYGTGSKKKPWVQVVPVYRLPDNDTRWGRAREWKVSYMVPIQSLGQRWVADLRIEMPVEKSYLIGKAPAGLLEDSARLEEHLRNQRGRIALADSIHERLLTPLSEWLRNLQDSELGVEFGARVTAAFVAVGGDVLMNPTVVQLIFLCSEPLSEQLVGSVQEWWDGLGDNQPWELLDNRYVAGDEDIPLSEQLSWYRLDLAALSES